MRLVLFLLVGQLLACGGQKTEPDFRAGRGINAEFLPYVASFEEDLNLTVINLPMSFSTLSPLVAGVCQYYEVTEENTFKQVVRRSIQKEILIDWDYWTAVGETEKKLLIYHELGHCVLGLEHDETTINVTGATPSVKEDDAPFESFVFSPTDFLVAWANETEDEASIPLNGWYIEYRQVGYSLMYPVVTILDGDVDGVMAHYVSVLKEEESPLGLERVAGQKVRRTIEEMIPELPSLFKEATETAEEIGYHGEIPLREGLDYEVYYRFDLGLSQAKSFCGSK